MKLLKSIKEFFFRRDLNIEILQYHQKAIEDLFEISKSNAALLATLIQNRNETESMIKLIANAIAHLDSRNTDLEEILNVLYNQQIEYMKIVDELQNTALSEMLINSTSLEGIN